MLAVSWQATSAAVAALEGREDLTHTDALVLLALAHFASADGVAWPSTERLAGVCHLHASNVRRALYRLRDAGVLEAETRTGRTTRYTLAVGESYPQPSALARTPDETTQRASAHDPARHRAPRSAVARTYTTTTRSIDTAGETPGGCADCDGTHWVEAPNAGRSGTAVAQCHCHPANHARNRRHA